MVPSALHNSTFQPQCRPQDLQASVIPESGLGSLQAGLKEWMIYLLPLEGTCPFSSPPSMDKCETTVLDMRYGSLYYSGGLWPREEGEEHSHRMTLF